MKKYTFLTLLTMGTTLSAPSLHAEEMRQGFLSDVYIFAKGAYTMSDYSKSDLSAFNGRYIDISDDGFSYGFGIGYNLTKNWHAEIGYLDLYDSEILAEVPIGTSIADIESIAPIESGDGWTIQLGYRYFFTSDWALWARAGAFFWDADESFELVQIESTSGSDDDIAPYYSAGLEYIINPSWSLETTIDRVEFKESPATLFGLKINYHFGNSQNEAYPVETQAIVEEPQKEVSADKPSNVSRHWELQSGYFEVNSFKVKTENMPWLAEFVEIMEASPQAKIEIVGHTDDSGSAAYNLELSEKRAEAVKEELIAVGINPERITATGEGESSPAYSNATASGRENNRRVDIIIPEFNK